MRPHLVVIGGGITGLAAAWTVARSGAGLPDGLQVTVLECDAEVGGKARSHRDGEWLAEDGPGGFLSGRPALERIIREAALDGETVTAAAAAARRFVYFNGALRRVRPSPVGLVRAGLLDVRGALRLLGEPFVARRETGPEESVWEFAARRIGPQAADRLVAPMTLGVYAGDARQLSLPSAFPRMAALEADHGSLVRGLIAKRGRMASGTLTTFRGGLQALPHALAARGRFAVRTGAPVQALSPHGGGWRLGTAHDEPIHADAVIIATEAWAAAPLLDHFATTAADALRDIHCPPVTVVSLGFAPGDTPGVPRGFGVLIARGERIRSLGNLWDSQFFPSRSPSGHLLLRAMLGGAVDPDAGALDDDAAIALVREEGRRLYGTTALPTFTRVVRWPRAIPQYTVGHAQRLQTVRAALAAHRGLFIAGSALDGVAFADAATSGVAAAEAAATWLRHRSA